MTTITYVFLIAGFVTISIAFWLALYNIVRYVMNIVNVRYRPQFLCRHEYVPDYIWNMLKAGSEEREYVFTCRKCGKEHHVVTVKTDKIFKLSMGEETQKMRIIVQRMK